MKTLGKMNFKDIFAKQVAYFVNFRSQTFLSKLVTIEQSVTSKRISTKNESERTNKER